MRVRMKKCIWTVLCAVALLGVLCLPAFAADDPYYSGAIDPSTGAPVTSMTADTSSRIQINGTTYYDREAHSFAYPTGSGIREVYANVADGMIVNEPVKIEAEDGVEVTVTRNGTVLESVDLGSISAVGNYTVAVKDIETTRTLFGFTIVGSSTNLPGGYRLPDGFYILNATLDGEDTDFDRDYIGMDEEGLYEVEYVCPETSIHYTLTTTIDRTPPQITLEGKQDKNGRFHSAVQIGGIEPGSTVGMTRDGDNFTYPSDGRLTEAGMYLLQVYDPAGNTATEQFTILVYLDLNSLMFFAVLVLVNAAVVTYIFFKRKKLKIV